MEKHELEEVLNFSHKHILMEHFSKDIKVNIKENVEDADEYVTIKADVLINCIIYFYINAFKYKVIFTKIELDQNEYDVSLKVFLNLESKRLKSTSEYRNQIINESIKTMNRDFPMYTKKGYTDLFSQTI